MAIHLDYNKERHSWAGFDDDKMVYVDGKTIIQVVAKIMKLIRKKKNTVLRRRKKK